MGQFAGALFSVLLGWVQTAAAALWGLFTNADMSAWLQWLLDHWLSVTLLLCLGGAVIDFLVYLLRWQPYRVWGRFLRRMTTKETADAMPEHQQPAFQRTWLYADGSTTVEDVHDPLQEQTVPAQSMQLEAPVRPSRRVARRTSYEQSYHQPVYPPQWQYNTQEQGENE